MPAVPIWHRVPSHAKFYYCLGLELTVQGGQSSSKADSTVGCCSGGPSEGGHMARATSQYTHISIKKATHKMQQLSCLSVLLSVLQRRDGGRRIRGFYPTIYCWAAHKIGDKDASNFFCRVCTRARPTFRLIRNNTVQNMCTVQALTLRVE